MESFWTAASELWWIAPTVVAAGGVGLALFRRGPTVNGRRIAYEAARLELREAQQDARSAVAAARVARAEAARVSADRAASRSDATAVGEARRALREAQHEAKICAARVRASRARISAERAAMSAGGGLPLDRLRARHDAVLARWMEYETDPAKLLAFPMMSDGRHPVTAVFLSAVQSARDLRPRDEVRFTASDYIAYRTAVERLETTFGAAERAVRGEPERVEIPDALRDAAQTVVMRTTEVISRTSEVIASFSAWRNRDR